MDSQGINGKLTSMGCTGLTDQDIKDLELEIDDDDDTLST